MEIIQNKTPVNNRAQRRLLFAAFGFLRENKNHRGDEGVRQNSSVTHVNSNSQNHLIPIEQVQLGQRVVTDISDWQRHKAVDPSDQPSWDLGEVDQYSWRQISFDAQSTFGDIVSIQLLRPLGWIEDQGVAIGNTIHLTLDGLGVDGPAKVLAVSDCPAIAEGAGQVVTGKFTHSRDGIIRIYIAGAANPIRVSDNHLVYSVKDRDFVAAEELEVGDQFEGADGPISIVRIEPETTAAQVYNLEIHGEHVFRVTGHQILVHNDCGDGARFIGDDKGNIVDTHTTPPGSYDQPGGGRTDILQVKDHGSGHTHTHDPILNTNPNTGEVFINGHTAGRPITPDEIDNIASGLATPSAPKRR